VGFNVSGELRAIPPVDRLLSRFGDEFPDVPRPLLREALRALTDDLRERVRTRPPKPGTTKAHFENGGFKAELSARLHALSAPRHCAVVNATGVLLHTGLGRAPLSDSARAALGRIARYGLVEIDPVTGERGRRELFVRDLLCELTGAEEATVVNNNAAAVMLLLRGLALGREVVVSRGELVEIGGGFRVPDVMLESGAKLREVGTTNRTRVADFAAAIGPETALLLNIHTSNFKLVGFTEAPKLAELVALGRERKVTVAADLGSGYLRRFAQLPFPDEPAIVEAVAAGCDVVTFSGDKMLGGPQCGILVGKKEAILKLRREPLFRAIRPDKLTLAALEATLREWRKAGDGLPLGVPFYAMLAAPLVELRRRAEAIVAQSGLTPPFARVIDSRAQVGSGSVPGFEFDSVAIALAAAGGQADALATRLRTGEPKLFARVNDGRVLLDLRTIFADEDAGVAAALKDVAPAAAKRA
jgi:L-seryl-tRNA(Ser) seleniumtransferase